MTLKSLAEEEKTTVVNTQTKVKTLTKESKQITARSKSHDTESAILATIEALPGPFTRALKRWEKDHNIWHEFYHGGSFNGNTCQVILKNRISMLQSLQPILVQSTEEIPLWFGDNVWLEKELLRWNKFASLEELYSANRPLCEHEIRLLECRAVDFGFFLPRAFKTELLSHKFHIFVAEMHHYAKLKGAKGLSPGMGMHQTRSHPLLSNPHELFAGNEQSIEAIHVKYNKEARRFRQAKTAALRLKRMVASMHTKSNAGSKHRNPCPRPPRACK